MRGDLTFREGEADIWRAVVLTAVRAGHSAAKAMATADDVLLGLRARLTP